MVGRPSKTIFDTIRNGLREVGFLEEPIAQRLREAAVQDDELGVLVGLFVAGRPVAGSQARNALGALCEAFEAAGLLEDRDGRLQATAMLYPVEDLWIASDFPGRRPGDDFVFPALSPQTIQFHSILPDNPCESLLDLGCGAGAATLLAAKDYAETAAGGDISARAVRFAEFNRRLNGIENAVFRESDLFDAFAPEDFDRIIAHPPYIPSLNSEEAYRHGGPLGESVLRRILAALGEHLRPGGRAYLSCLGCDTAEAPLEERIRAMLGPAREEFAVLVGEWEALSGVEFVMRLVEAGELDFDQGQRQAAALRAAGVTQLVRCAVVAARQPEAECALTMRRKMGRRTGGAELDAVFDPPPAAPSLMVDYAWACAPGLRLERDSLLHGGDWRDTAIILDSQHPFAFRTDCPSWAAAMLPLLDGHKTPRELLDDDIDIEEVEIFLECLAAAGVLRV